jgi:hypothetical protein
MDRLTVEYGQLPLETDLLYAQRFAMVGLAKNAETILGTNTIVDGFALAPTSPAASMSLVLSPGVIYELENLERTPWSSLSEDTHNIVKQGILLDAATLTFTAPVTVGYATNCLVQVQYQDLDTGAVVRPYFDSANPTLPFEGPGNAGTADNTIRKGAVFYNVKVGTPSPAGTQTTPPPDAGYAGLWVVTIPAGTTSLNVGNVAMYDFAPFLPVKLPGVPAGVQNCDWIGADDTGTTNAMAAKIWPPVTSLKKYMTVKVKAAYANTGATTFNLNNLGPIPVVNKDGTDLPASSIYPGSIVTLTYDGAKWQKFTAESPPPAAAAISDVALWHYGVGNSADPNNITVTTTPTFAAHVDGLQVCLKANNTNTSSSVTMNANGRGQIALVLPGGSGIPPGAIVAGHDYYFALNLAGNQWVMMAPALPQAGGNVSVVAYQSGGNYSLQVPPWATWMSARLWGGGGAGGAGGNGGGGGGGGGGEYREGSWLIGTGQQIASSATLSITVGAGGTSSVSGADGGNGGTSSISGLVAAVGGTGGPGNRNTPFLYQTGAPGGTGGSGGSLAIRGGSGGNDSAFATSSGGGAYASPTAPNQNVTIWDGSQARGADGGAPGGGGGGSAATYGLYPVSGKGGDGAVIITFGS